MNSISSETMDAAAAANAQLLTQQQAAEEARRQAQNASSGDAVSDIMEAVGDVADGIGVTDSISETVVNGVETVYHAGTGMFAPVVESAPEVVGTTVGAVAEAIPTEALGTVAEAVTGTAGEGLGAAADVAGAALEGIGAAAEIAGEAASSALEGIFSIFG